MTPVTKWRRFELLTEDRRQIEELEQILDRAKLTRRELAVILATLRVRPGFCLEDFDTGPRRSPRMLTVSPGKSKPGDAEAMAEGIKAYLQAQADSQSLKPCPSADKANQSAERQT